MTQYTYKYPRPAVTADCVVMTKEATPQVLLIERGLDPYKGCWAFPGGFMNMDETTEQCAIRELEEKTGIKLEVKDLTLLGVYSEINRDPRERTISVAYLAEIDAPMEIKGQDNGAKAEWFNLSGAPVTAFDHFDIYEDLFKKVFDKRNKLKLRELVHRDKIKELEEKIQSLEENLRQQKTIMSR
jgi:8-oxo-dGTP diphosphatase